VPLDFSHVHARNGIGKNGVAAAHRSVYQSSIRAKASSGETSFLD
jgi:hypothetical protein